MSMPEKIRCVGCEKQISTDDNYISARGPYCGECSNVIINKLGKMKQDELDDRMEREYMRRKRKNSKKVPSIAESVTQEQSDDKTEEELKKRK